MLARPGFPTGSNVSKGHWTISRDNFGCHNVRCTQFVEARASAQPPGSRGQPHLQRLIWFTAGLTWRDPAEAQGTVVNKTDVVTAVAGFP